MAIIRIEMRGGEIRTVSADAATVLIQAAWVQLKLAMQRDRMQRTVS